MFFIVLDTSLVLMSYNYNLNKLFHEILITRHFLLVINLNDNPGSRDIDAIFPGLVTCMLFPRKIVACDDIFR